MGKAILMPSGHMPSKADPDMKQGLWVPAKCKAARPSKCLETRDATPSAVCQCLTEWHRPVHIGNLLRKEKSNKSGMQTVQGCYDSCLGCL